MKKADYERLLVPIVTKQRQQRYDYWRDHVEGEPIVLEMSAGDGTACCVEISVFWDDEPDGDIRVIISIDDGGWRAFIPVTETFIIGRDGKFVGE